MLGEYKMILTRSPLRITLGGGGTDLPSYASKYGGFCISATINKYCYVAVNHTFNRGIKLKYSEMENPEKLDAIKHPIFREVLKDISLKTPQIELVSIADVPSNGAGLGNSASFTVSLIKAVYNYKNIPITNEVIAEKASDIAMNRLGKTQGKQDEYISTFGGITCMEFNTNGTVTHYPVKLAHDDFVLLEENLLLFYTGINHDTESILSFQNSKTIADNSDIINNLHEIKQIGLQAKSLLETGLIMDFGCLLNEQWANKEKRMPEKNEKLEEVHYALLENGAIGSKVVGSGNGGFILVYSADNIKVRRYMKSIGFEEMRFNFDFEGCKRLI